MRGRMAEEGKGVSVKVDSCCHSGQMGRCYCVGVSDLQHSIFKEEMYCFPVIKTNLNGTLFGKTSARKRT